MAGQSDKETNGVAAVEVHDGPVHPKKDLWAGAFNKELATGITVQMTGLKSPTHTVFARVQGPDKDKATVSRVVEAIVDEGWRHVAKEIMEKRAHILVDSYPPADQLLELGAVWIVNETAYAQGKDAHAHRLALKDEGRIPNWEDESLRVHYVPERFFAADEVDWGKYTKSLLVDKTVQVTIGDSTPHVPVVEGMPDEKDGVIVYEDHDHGFTVINKPGTVPVHATMSNHKQDAVSMFRKALVERKKNKHEKIHVSVPQRLSCTLDTETNGLLAISTRAEFGAYFASENDKHAVVKKFKCLVCVKDPDAMGILEGFQKSKTVVTHYVDQKSPAPKRFVRHKPKSGKGDWRKCEMRIAKVGDDDFRAACVRSVYPKSVDSCLAHHLWGPNSKTPGEDLGVQYVMELEMELLTAHTHQIQGQLAALGFPIVGDVVHGGGECDAHGHKHEWNRMALQCCELSFMEPQWENVESKKKLVPSENKAIFRLDKSWWSPYLAQYELYHKSY